MQPPMKSFLRDSPVTLLAEMGGRRKGLQRGTLLTRWEAMFLGPDFNRW